MVAVSYPAGAGARYGVDPGWPGDHDRQLGTDIWINGSYWLGSVIGTLAAFLLLNSLPADTGWRVGFLVGPVLAVVILLIRRNLPESPRWLLTHGRAAEAEASMKQIEDAAVKDGQHLAPVPGSAALTIIPEKEYGYLRLLRLIWHTYPRRAVLGGTLMITQSFLYNAIFFTYALVLTRFYHVTDNAVPVYGLAFAVGNLAGPLLLGHLFDTWGRRTMISGTYLISGAVLAEIFLGIDAEGKPLEQVARPLTAAAPEGGTP